MLYFSQHLWKFVVLRIWLIRWSFFSRAVTMLLFSGKESKLCECQFRIRMGCIMENFGYSEKRTRTSVVGPWTRLSSQLEKIFNGLMPSWSGLVPRRKLEQVMRNLTCGDQQILLMVIWLVLTRVETEEISYERLGSCFSWTCFMGWGKVWEADEEIGYTFLGDCCWEVQMRKNGVTIKRRNSL